MNTRIILDVDTGTDDAVALMVAALSPDIELVGATTVNGNTALTNCTENTLRVFDHIGLTGVPVHEGMSSRWSAPNAHQINPASRIHGDFLDLPPSRSTKGDRHAVDWLIDTYMASDGDITLVPVGPLTNIATAMRKEPRIIERIPELVIMGGAHDHGNATASAEFNIFLDPEAARIVVNCGRPIRMLPLDATHEALVSMEDCAPASGPRHAGRDGDRDVHREAHRGLRCDPADASTWRGAGPRCAGGLCGHRPDRHHDPLHPGRRGDRRRAVTGPDGRGLPRPKPEGPPNVHFAMDADEPKFVAMLTEILARTL